MIRLLFSFISRSKKEKSPSISKRLRAKLVEEDGNYNSGNLLNYSSQYVSYSYQYVFVPRNINIEEFRTIPYANSIWSIGRWVESDCGDVCYLAFIHNNKPLKGMKR